MLKFSYMTTRNSPQFKEIKTIIEVIDAVKQTYKFIHPMNKNPTKNGNFVEVLDEK